MKIEKVIIQNFRSIKYLSLNLEQINVLIGKNNSGKTNILNAINEFFDFFKNFEIAGNSELTKDILSFHNKDMSNSIEIELIFYLSDEEKKGIENQIKESATKLSFLRSYRFYRYLSLRLCFSANFEGIGFVKQIKMLKETDILNDEAGKILYSVEAEQASYLATYGLIGNKDFISSFGGQLLRLKILEEVWNQGNSFEKWFLKKHYKEDISEVIDYITNKKSLSDNELNGVTENFFFREPGENVDFSPGKDIIIKSDIGNFTLIPKYVFHIVDLVLACNIGFFSEERKCLQSNNANEILKLKLTRSGDRKFKEMKDIIRSILELNIEVYQTEEPLTRRDVAELDIDEFLLRVNGAGIREFVSVILEIFLNKPKIILFEEPELYLHPSLEKTLADYLKKEASGSQILITTHSTNFLDTLGINDLYLVSNKEATIVEKLVLTEDEDKILLELGISLSSVFMHEKLIFVEGKTDVQAIKNISFILDKSLDKYNVGFVIMHGVKNFSYFASSSLLKSLKAKNVKIWFFMDRDEKDSDEIQQLEKLVGELGTVMVLSKREMENYLLHPNLIHRFLSLKISLVRNKTEEIIEKLAIEKIKNMMEIEIDKFKDFTINKLLIKKSCINFYPDKDNFFKKNNDDIFDYIKSEYEEIKNTINEIEKNLYEDFQKIKKRIDNEWDENKYNLVSGSRLLDTICKHYGLRYNKKMDVDRITKLLLIDEIDQELKEIINLITS